MRKNPSTRNGVICGVDEFCLCSEDRVSLSVMVFIKGLRVYSPAKVRLITRAYRLDLFFAGSFDIIHMNRTAAVATLDKVLQIKVGIVMAGCHGMVAVKRACGLKGKSETELEIRPAFTLSTIVEPEVAG